MNDLEAQVERLRASAGSLGQTAMRMTTLLRNTAINGPGNPVTALRALTAELESCGAITRGEAHEIYDGLLAREAEEERLRSRIACLQEEMAEIAQALQDGLPGDAEAIAARNAGGSP